MRSTEGKDVRVHGTNHMMGSDMEIEARYKLNEKARMIGTLGWLRSKGLPTFVKAEILQTVLS